MTGWDLALAAVGGGLGVGWLGWISVTLIGLKVRLAELAQNQAAIIDRLDSGRDRMADHEQRLRALERP